LTLLFLSLWIFQVVKAKIKTPRITGVIPLVRVRNPWGNETEWRGTWADNAKEWSFIPEEEKEALGITFSADGEWWMAFKDFKEHFDQVEVCNLSPECLESCGLDKRFQWCVNSFNSAWISGETAGGCRNYIDTFALNPQFKLTLEDSSEDEDSLCTLIVSLMQKNRRAMRDEGLAYLSLGFVIYRLKPEMSADERVDVDFFKYNLSVARSKSFINQREVTQRFRLEPGRYLIVPSTYDPGYEGEFLLRTFSEKSSTCKQIP
ncbi:calpain-A, partial [Eurytemora carolleeae]|uniref:calpain-A n=1 Tax=Eurytemora carolleeae TaxID=1294199 RepID=UPI000C75BEB8